MAVYVRTIIKYLCPRCREDVAKRPGVINTPAIACHVCGHEFLVNRAAVLHSWQKTLFRYAFLFLFVVGIAFFFTVPSDLSATMWNELKQGVGTFAGYVVGVLLGIALLAGIGAFPFGLVVGWIAGNSVANRICSD